MDKDGKKKFSLGIRGKLMGSFTVLLAIPILILGTYTYHQSKRNLEEQSVEVVENNLSGLVSELDARCAREDTYIKYLAYNLKFRRLLEQTPVDRVALALELNNSVEPIFWYYITSDDYVKSIQIFTDKLDEGIGYFLEVADAVEEQSWYLRSKESPKNLWNYEDGTFFISRSILDADTVRQSIGVMRLDLVPSMIMEPLNAYRYMDNGIYVTDGRGNPIYARPTEAGHVDEAVIRAIGADRDQDGAGYILRTAEISTSGWKVYYYIDRAAVTEQLRPIIGKTLLAVSAVIVIATAVMLVFSKALSRRILKLRDYAEQVAAGDLDAVIESDDTDEVGQVINSFGSMTQQLNQMINQVYKIRLEKKTAELSALQAKINPHFLYNALSSMKWMAIQTENDDISNATGLLATFYRTSLNNGSPITVVCNELENVRAYIELQRYMHGRPFEAVYDIDERALPLRMPNFLLQPLVENAFKHGLDYVEEGQTGRLEVICHLDKERLVFCVKNNGPHIPPETLESVLTKPGRGYGLYNIQERIRLYYGQENMGLSASIDETGNTCFWIRIGTDCTEADEINS